MANVKVTKKARFGGQDIFLVGLFSAAIVGLTVLLLIIASNLFDDTTTTVTNSPATGEETTGSNSSETSDAGETKTVTNDLATAQFAITVLLVLGGLCLVGGLSVALTEVVEEEAEATPAEEAVRAARDATGIGAIFAGAAELAKGLGEALKGMKASAMLVLMGGLLLITAGAVAWQSIPDTDRNPTFTTTETTDTTSSGDVNGDDTGSTDDSTPTTPEEPSTTSTSSP
jgi:hypothetical protein